MAIEQAIFRRAELLLGDKTMERIARKRVIIFGVGGVGSWCAESLVRSGIRQLTIVDSDRVCITNVNRQLMATMKTVGKVKVDALKERLLTINPKAEITALQKIFTAETAADFHLEGYDYIIDAIDSLKDKAALILLATNTPSSEGDGGRVRFFSSMGAALKLDPTRIKVAEFWKVQGDPLARALRNRFKKEKTFPRHKFQCIYSDELLKNLGRNSTCGTEQCMCPKAKNGPGDPDLLNHEWCSSKAQINGTLAHITAIFGFMLAGLVLQDVHNSELTS
jgi:tRNA A37 threonylcarbamoyladenosine dehydratase